MGLAIVAHGLRERCRVERERTTAVEDRDAVQSELHFERIEGNARVSGGRNDAAPVGIAAGECRL